MTSAAALLETAEAAARAAGELLAERFCAGAETQVHSKSTATDLASEADLAAERAVLAVLRDRAPDDAVLAEEGGGAEEAPGGGRRRWLVDPLDGTINFLFRIPHWCVTVACEDADGMLAGVVLDPLRGELFTATRGGPAMLDGAPLSARAPAALAESLVVTGFAYDAEVRARQADVVARLAPLARDVRRMGSAALDLAWTAAGRYDAYFERTVKPWDVAAGMLLCRCSGLEVRELPARPGLPPGVMAGHPQTLDALEGIGA